MKNIKLLVLFVAVGFFVSGCATLRSPIASNCDDSNMIIQAGASGQLDARAEKEGNNLSAAGLECGETDPDSILYRYEPSIYGGR